MRTGPLPPPGGVLLICALAAAPAAAGDLLLPVDCTPGRDCFIQHHVDRDPGPGTTDFACGTLAYDGHDGTDIRLPDEAAMRAGVAVLAAAPGLVRGVRDGVPDIAAGAPGAPDSSGRECGNGVLVERADRSELQYCHLREGSIRVAPGDRVIAGQPLGEIGLSGQSQFPHLHFTVRDAAGRTIDPFDGRRGEEPCAAADYGTLWAAPLPYQPGGVLADGFLDRVPDYAEVQAGTAGASTLPGDAPGLVFWAHFFGLRAGDRLELRLLSPDGAVLSETAHAMERNRATEFRAIGLRAGGAWPPGGYAGEARLLRGGSEIDSRKSTVRLR